MSFSRARIRRFNDDTGNTPAPGSYDPKFDTKIIGTGAVIEKCERFAAPKSIGGQIPPPASLNTSFSAGRKSSSLSNLPVFRTPKIPQKAKKAVSVKGKGKVVCYEKQPVEKLSPFVEGLLNVKELQIRDLEVDLELLKEEYERCEKHQSILFLEMKQKMDAFQATIAERDVTVESQQALITQNISEINHLKEEMLDKKLLSDKLRQLASSNKSLTAQNSEFINQKHALDEKVDDLVKEIFKLRSAEKELRVKLFDAEETVVELSLSMKKIDEKMEFLQVENFAEKVLLEDKIEDMQSQKDELQKNLADKEASISLLKKSVEDANWNVGKLNDKLKALLSDFKNKDLTALECREEFEKKVAQKQEMILLLQAELSEKEIELEELSSEQTKMLEQAECDGTHLRDFEAKVAELHRKIDDLTKNLKMMEENAMNASILKENMESTISCHQSAFEALQVDYDALRIDLEGRMVNQIMDSSRKFSELSFELLETRGKLQCLENNCSSLDQTRLNLESSLVTLMQEIESHVLARDELRVINLDYQLTIADLHNKTDSLSVEINANSTYWAEQVEKSRTEANKLRHQCKVLEIGSANTLETLQAVSDRLVECSQISEVQGELIAKIQEYNSVLEKKIFQQAEVLESQKLSMILMEAESIREIEEVRKSLLEKLEQMGQCYQIEKKTVEREIGEELLTARLQINDMAVENSAERYRFGELEQLHVTLQHNFKLNGVALEETKFDLLRLQDVLKEKEEKIAIIESDIAIIFQDSEQSALSHKAQLEAVLKSLTEKNVKMLAVEATNIQLDKKLASKDSEATELKKQLEMQLFEFKNKLTGYKTENSSLKNKLASLTKSTEIASHEIQARNQILTTELNEASTKCHEAMQEVESLNLLISAERLEHENDKISFLATIKEKDECLYSQAEREEQWSLLSAENIAKDVHIRQLNSALKLASSQLDSLSNEILAKEKQLSELKEGFQQLKEKFKCQESENWKSKYQEIASLVGPFRQQLEEFEAERRKLESRKEEADNQVKDLSMKYAQVLGHQNHRQKIHHVVQLKEHNLELKQTVEKLEGEIRSRDKTLKKMKSELANATRFQKQPANKSRMPMTPLALTRNENTTHSPGRQSPGVKTVV